MSSGCTRVTSLMNYILYFMLFFNKKYLLIIIVIISIIIIFIKNDNNNKHEGNVDFFFEQKKHSDDVIVLSSSYILKRNKYELEASVNLIGQRRPRGPLVEWATTRSGQFGSALPWSMPLNRSECGHRLFPPPISCPKTSVPTRAQSTFGHAESTTREANLNSNCGYKVSVPATMTSKVSPCPSSMILLPNLFRLSMDKPCESTSH